MYSVKNSTVTDWQKTAGIQCLAQRQWRQDELEKEPWVSERGLVLTDWSWESQQAVTRHTKSCNICRCITLGRYHQSSKQQQRNHRWQHSHWVLGTSLGDLLLCHCILGLCGFPAVVQQLNLSVKTGLWTMHIAGLMNRRTAWTVLLSYPVLLPK